MIKQDETDRLQHAMFSPSLPCNPRPFLRGMDAHLEERGTDWIRTKEAKRMLWVVMAQAFGQMAKIDMCDLWDELRP